MIDKIKTYSSVITAIFSAAVVLYGVFKFINQGNENSQSVEKIQVQLEEMRETYESPLLRFDSLQRAIINVQSTVSKTDRKLDIITRQMNNHYSKDNSISKEELMQMIQEQQQQQQKQLNWYDTLNFKINIRKK